MATPESEISPLRREPAPAETLFIDDDWDASEGYCFWGDSESFCEDSSTPDDFNRTTDSNGTLTIHDIDSQLLEQLRVRAAKNGRSMEEEALEILRCALSAEPERGSMREPPKFG